MRAGDRSVARRLPRRAPHANTAQTPPGSPMPEQIDASRKIVIECVEPELDCGRYAVKREVGDTVRVYADIFKEGHDAIAAAVRYRHEQDFGWHEAPMKFWDNDRWTGSFAVDRIGRWE